MRRLPLLALNVCVSASLACGPPGHVVLSSPLGGGDTAGTVQWKVWESESSTPHPIPLVNTGEGDARIERIQPLDGESVGYDPGDAPKATFVVTFPKDRTMSRGETAVIDVALSRLSTTDPLRASFEVDFTNAEPITLHLEAQTFVVGCPQIPDTIDFGTVDIGQTATRTFEFDNPSSERVTITTVTIPDSTSGGTITISPANVSIDPGMHGSFAISFRPSFVGHDESLFSVSFNRFCAGGGTLAQGSGR